MDDIHSQLERRRRFMRNLSAKMTLAQHFRQMERAQRDFLNMMSPSAGAPFTFTDIIG